MIYFIFKWLATIIILRIILVKGIKITPSSPIYIRLSNSTFNNNSIICERKYYPIQWYFETYDGSLFRKRPNRAHMIRNTYISELSLIRESYLDTGYYYCTSLIVKTYFIKQFPKIYVFIQDDKHLFAIPNDFNIIWHDSEKDEVILPCRPTSPDVVVKLFLNGTELTHKFHYNEQIGFTLDEIGPYNYTCVAQRKNITEERIIFIRIINLKISPALSEYTLTSNSTQDDRVFTCKGNEPVQWYFEQYDGSLLEKNSESIKNILPKYENKYTYSTSFLLVRATYLDTGYYYCAPLHAEPKFIKEFKNIYIFIKQMFVLYLEKTHLFAFPDDYSNIRFSIINGTQSNIIPCRPTTPDIKIQVFRTGDSDEMISGFYNEKIGFILPNFGQYRDQNFSCVAIRNSIRAQQQFIDHITDRYRINNGYSDKIISGQNVTLNCSSTPFFTNFFNKLSVLKWIVPGKMKYQTERVSIDPEQTFFVEQGSIVINIQNVTVNDEGYYICNVMVKDEFEESKFNISYDLNVIAPNETYINLKILDDTSVKIRPAGYDSVNWIVRVSAYPNAILEWTNPKGNKVERAEGKIYVKNDNRSSQLFIRNLKLLDSGVYKLIAYNGVKKKEVNVTLLVEDKPIIESINSSKSGSLYCKFGNLCKFEFLVSGYPLLVTEWTYTNCKNDTSAECDTPIKIKNVSLTPVTQKYIIILIVIETGTLICNASNIFGNSIEEYSIFIASDEDDLSLSYGKLWTNHIMYILPILVVVIIFGGVLWFTMKRKSKRKVAAYRKKEFEMGTVENWNPDLEVVEQAYLLPYDNRWEIPIDKVELGEQLGSGEFGVVYKAKVTGIFNDNTTNTVALKTIKPTTDPCHRMALASELKIMTHLGRHLNIVNLLGACTVQINKKLMLIFEYCCFGSIDRYMQKHRAGFINQITPYGFIDYGIETMSNIIETRDFTGIQVFNDGHQFLNKFGLKNYFSPRINHTKYINSYQPLSTNDLLCWSYQVSIGMDYLTSRKIVHGDLATRNILLAEDNVVKICDFGLAKNIYKSEIYKMSKKTLLPVKWLSIESMRDGIFSTASDVWSFGIVLWEIFSLAAVPYPNVQLDDLLDKLVEGYRMEPPIYTNAKLYDIMLDCWKSEPTERPSFSDLAVRLGDLLQECTKSKYVKLNDHHEKMYSEILPLTDTLGLLAATTRSKNSLNTPENYIGSSKNISEHYTTIGDIEMNTIKADNTC